jgi:transposase
MYNLFMLTHENVLAHCDHPTCSDVLACPHCHSQDRQVKNGYSLSGTKKIKCQICNKTYTKDPKPYRGHPPEVKLEAIKLYIDGVNFRRIGRILGVHNQTVINWVNAYHQKQKEQNPNFPHENPADSAFNTQIQNDRTQSRSLEVVEGDELYTFVSDKKTMSTS